MPSIQKAPKSSAGSRTLKALPSIILTGAQDTTPLGELTPETLTQIRETMSGHIAYQISDWYSSAPADWQKFMDFASHF